MAVPGPHGHTVAVPSAKDKPNADPAQFAGTRFDWNDLTFFQDRLVPMIIGG